MPCDCTPCHVHAQPVPSNGALGMRAGDRIILLSDLNGHYLLPGYATEFYSDGSADIQLDDGRQMNINWRAIRPIAYARRALKLEMG